MQSLGRKDIRLLYRSFWPAIKRIKIGNRRDGDTEHHTLAKEKACDKITVLSVAPIFAEAITRIYEGLSVSKLFVKN